MKSRIEPPNRKWNFVGGLRLSIGLLKGFPTQYDDGDGLQLPFADGTFDVSHSSNVVEHVVDPHSFFDEMLRVPRPGGLMFLAFTDWFSPFGGHETSPWHYLAGEGAAQRYECKLGYAPENRFGTSLYRLDISDVSAWSPNRRDAEVTETFPRY